jgi:tetratricopeptide (TPR) repeat protein
MKMIDIDRQIEMAKKKPINAENLNYIGDLYLKKNDKQRAVAYFFEACDKLHFAQKDKKVAIYKKILNVSPVSEKAYIGIIEILSKMGLIMEEKKFLHMLAELYDSKGESDKVAELFARIKELDPHVILDGTFFHPEAHKEVRDLGESQDKESRTENIYEQDSIQPASETKPDADLRVPAPNREEEKLIEAKPKEPSREESYSATLSSEKGLRPRHLLVAGVVLIFFVAGALYYFLAGNRGHPVTSLPVSTRFNDYEITLSKLNDVTELTGVVSKHDLDNTDFIVLTVKTENNCLPDAFATSPYNMISLLDRKGRTARIKPVEGVQKATRTISKMNVCGRDNAVVFVKTIISVDRQNPYAGLALSGLQNTGPLTIRWDLP